VRLKVRRSIACRAGINVTLVVVCALSISCVRRVDPEPVELPGSVRVGTDTNDKTLRKTLDGVFGSDQLGSVLWGVEVRSLDRRERLYARNSELLLTPASTMKIVTLAAAVDVLGWDHQFDTTLSASARIESMTLQGDLVVRGTGDPTINAPGTEKIFVDWAEELQGLGIRSIAGRIVGDDDELIGRNDGGYVPGFGAGWAWDDLVLGFATPVGSLQHRENVADVVVGPNSAAGRLGHVRIQTPWSGLIVLNEVITVGRREPTHIELFRAPRTNVLRVTGQIAQGRSSLVRKVSVNNPTLFFVRSLKDALEQAGIAVEGQAIDIDSLSKPDKKSLRQGLRTLAQHMSSPLSDIAVSMMKRSQNLYAESLLYRIGSVEGRGIHGGREVVSDLLADWGVRRPRIAVADGSGLSRYNYLTASALVDVLDVVYRDQYWQKQFIRTLPIAGRDGTLRRRFRGTAAEGVVRAKTGSMSRVRALSGYVQTADGEQLAFAILANNFSANSRAVNGTIDDVVAFLASYSRDE